MKRLMYHTFYYVTLKSLASLSRCNRKKVSMSILLQIHLNQGYNSFSNSLYYHFNFNFSLQFSLVFVLLVSSLLLFCF